jgi:Uma2 family endonuclease
VTWDEIICNPMLRNLPFKVETNRLGQIVMTEKTNVQGAVQFAVGRAIDRSKKNGQIIFGCSVMTSDGVKVVSVAWLSDQFLVQHGYSTPYLKAPELCVEIVSSANTKAELENKIELYLAKGALEVWVVSDKKEVTFYAYPGKLKKSKLVPKFKI